MVIYKGDLVLSSDDRFVINRLCSSSKSMVNIRKKVNILGLGEISIKIALNDKKRIYLLIKGDNIDNPIKSELLGQSSLYDIVSAYKFDIYSKGEEHRLLLNIKFDKFDFIRTNDYYLKVLEILKYKIDNESGDDLILYMEYLDFNYMLNIIYGAFIIHTYNIIHNYDVILNNLSLMFIEKLANVGINIPKVDNDISKKIEIIFNKINNLEKLKPEDMIFGLINTMPNSVLAKDYKIKSSGVFFTSIHSLIKENKKIECL